MASRDKMDEWMNEKDNKIESERERERKIDSKNGGQN